MAHLYNETVHRRKRYVGSIMLVTLFLCRKDVLTLLFRYAPQISMADDRKIASSPDNIQQVPIYW